MEDKIETKIMHYLSAQMRDAVDLQIENLQRVAHGASRECYNLDLRWKDGKTQHYRACLLRRDPTASLLESERDTEFRILRALENSGVPVPKVYWLESDPSVLERPFLIMERLTGEVTPSFGLLAGDDAEMRESLANQAMEILARVHTLDYKKFGLDFLGVPSTPTGFAEAMIDHWEGVVKKASLMGPQPVLTEAILWLRANVPPDQPILTTQAHTLNYASGYPTLSIPVAQDASVLRQVAERYDVRYVVITEKNGQYPQALEQPEARARLIVELSGTMIYELLP